MRRAVSTSRSSRLPVSVAWLLVGGAGRRDAPWTRPPTPLARQRSRSRPPKWLDGGDIHSAGDGFNADCGPSIPSDHWQRLTGDAEIAGVAYFAVRHSSSTPGAAPNGLELHPVMSFWAPGCRQLNARWP